MIDINELAIFALQQQQRIESNVFGIDAVLVNSGNDSYKTEKFLQNVCEKIIEADDPDIMKKSIISTVDYISTLATFIKEEQRAPESYKYKAALSKIKPIVNTSADFMASVDHYYGTFQRLSKFIETKNGQQITKDKISKKVTKPNQSS